VLEMSNTKKISEAGSRSRKVREDDEDPRKVIHEGSECYLAELVGTHSHSFVM